MESMSKRSLPGILVVLLSLVGCASSSNTSGTFQSYSDSFGKARAGMEAGDLTAVSMVYGKDAAEHNGAGLLANWELGAAYHSAGQWEASQKYFDTADSIARDIEQKAVISSGDAAKVAGAMVTNDAALEFKGDAYEKVMAHTLNALNYLAIGRLDGARVEIRKADEYQKAELERHGRALQKADEKDAKAQAQKKNEEVAAQQKEIRGEFDRMASFTASVKNSFQNPLTYFVSGLVYEAHGEKDDALLDYRKALELAPTCRPIQAAAVAMRRDRGNGEAMRAAAAPPKKEPAASTTRSQRRPRLKPAAKPVARTIAAPLARNGDVVVIYEAGFVPQKREVKLALPMPGGSVGFTAFPVYTDYTSSPERLELVGAFGTVRTDPVVDTHVLAVKALQEKWFGIAGRELGRLVTKEVLKQQAEARATKLFGSTGGLIANIVGTTYNAASARADLRGFYALPQQVQAAQLNLPEGEYDLRLRRVGIPADPAEKPLRVRVEAFRKTIITVRGVGSLLNIYSFGI